MNSPLGPKNSLGGKFITPKTLTPLQPPVSKKLIQPKPEPPNNQSGVGSTNSSRSSSSSSSHTPESWSSAEDLINRSTIQTAPSPPKKHKSHSIQELSLLPFGTNVGATGNIMSPYIAQRPTDYQKVLKESIQKTAELKIKTSQQQSFPLETIKKSELEGIAQEILPTPPLDAATTQAEQKEEDKSDKIDLLAREIYHLLRQRLQVERERHGFYYSSRYLSW